MYKIDMESNSIQPLEQKSFSSLGFRERGHLQEWIAKQPNVLGEDLLIIQNEGVSQRIILIAAKFRKEVTSTVLWLMNFGIRLQCFRAALFVMDKEQFLNVEQIIPTQDTEDYMIGMAEKARDDIESKAERGNRHIVREDFWKEPLKQAVEQVKNDSSE